MSDRTSRTKAQLLQRLARQRRKRIRGGSDVPSYGEVRTIRKLERIKRAEAINGLAQAAAMLYCGTPGEACPFDVE